MNERKQTLIGFAVSVIVVLFVHPALCEAGIFWTDDFENHLTPNWNTSACGSAPVDGCNGFISNTLKHGGNYSLQSHYPTAGVQAGTYYDRSTSPTNDIWMRFYYQTTNFTYDPINTKHFFNMGNGLNVIWMNMWGDRTIEGYINHPQNVICPNGKSDISCLYPPNVSNISLNNGQWYCIETHAYAGTPGVANGLIEIYVNESLTLRYPNLLMTTSGNTFNLVRHYTQQGYGDRFIDDLAVGNTRIGCMTSQQTVTPPPTTSTGTVTPPPATPTGLVIQ